MDEDFNEPIDELRFAIFDGDFDNFNKLFTPIERNEDRLFRNGSIYLSDAIKHPKIRDRLLANKSVSTTKNLEQVIKDCIHGEEFSAAEFYTTYMINNFSRGTEMIMIRRVLDSWMKLWIDTSWPNENRPKGLSLDAMTIWAAKWTDQYDPKGKPFRDFVHELKDNREKYIVSHISIVPARKFSGSILNPNNPQTWMVTGYDGFPKNFNNQLVGFLAPKTPTCLHCGLKSPSAD